MARVDIPRSVCMFRWREKAVVASKIRIMPSVINVYFQHSSSSQSAAQKSWKHATGDYSCSAYSSPNAGSGISNEFEPKSSTPPLASLDVSPGADAYDASGSAVGQPSGSTR